MSREKFGPISLMSNPHEGRKKNNKQELFQEVVEDIRDNTIGQEGVKRELGKVIAFARLYAERKERDLPVGGINLHMMFTGAPGTGKTMMARKIAKLFYAIGLLKTDKLVEIDRSDVAGQALGQAAVLMREKVKDALDGVLFIDEAYTLAGQDALNGNDKYGQEVIDTLLKYMEDYRDRLVVIAAGYTTPMRRFRESNAGLKSRMHRELEFKSFNHDELFQILQLMCDESGYHMDEQALYQCDKHIRSIAKTTDEEFGNARTIRNIVEDVIKNQSERLGLLEDLSELSNDDLGLILEDDVTPTIEAWR